MFDGGDANPCPYVGNDPVNLIDPSGLSKNASTRGMADINGGGGGRGACSRPPGRFNPNQQAVVDLAKRANERGGLNKCEAEQLRKWASEYGINFGGPEVHPNSPIGQEPHFHIGPINHIPLK